MKCLLTSLFVRLCGIWRGVGGYNIAVVGLLTFVSNWAGPLWWSLATILLLLSNRALDRPASKAPSSSLFKPSAEGSLSPSSTAPARSEETENKIDPSRDSKHSPSASPRNNDRLWIFIDHLALQTLFTATSLVFVMAACTALRTHLFIWTVFSPKYLYSMAWTIGQHLGINVLVAGAIYWIGCLVER